MCITFLQGLQDEIVIPMEINIHFDEEEEQFNDEPIEIRICRLAIRTLRRTLKRVIKLLSQYTHVTQDYLKILPFETFRTILDRLVLLLKHRINRGN